MHLKAFKMVIGLVAVCWSLFLTFKILEHIKATELMWFVYYTFIPISIILGILQALVEDDK